MLRRPRSLLAFVLVLGCSEPASSGTGTETGSGSGETSGPTSASVSSTEGTTSTSTTSGSSTEGMADASSSGGSSSGGDFDPLDPSRLQWELLPPIGDDPQVAASDAGLSVSAAGEIVVSAVSVSTAFTGPWTVDAYRLDGDGWVTLGDSPAATSPEPILGTAVAALEGEVLLVHRVGSAGTLSSFVDGTWSTPSVDPSAPGDVSVFEVTLDRLGRPLVYAVADGAARVYRREDGAWAQLGGDLQAPLAAFTPGGSLVTGPGGRAAVPAGGAIHLFDGAAWLNLGAVSTNPIHTNERLAIASDGTLLVSWREDMGTDTVLYAAAWDPDSEAFVRFPGTMGLDGTGADFPGIALDPADTLFATWREASTAVIVARFVDRVWAPYIGDGNPGGAMGTLPELRLSPEGLPVVVWEASSPEAAAYVGVARAVPL